MSWICGRRRKLRNRLFRLPQSLDTTLVFTSCPVFEFLTYLRTHFSFFVFKPYLGDSTFYTNSGDDFYGFRLYFPPYLYLFHNSSLPLTLIQFAYPGICLRSSFARAHLLPPPGPRFLPPAPPVNHFSP